MYKERTAVIATLSEHPTANTGRLPPLTAAERVQRTRNRKKKGLLLVTLEIRASERAALVRGGFLAPDKARDKPATQDAIYAFLETVLDP